MNKYSYAKSMCFLSSIMMMLIYEISKVRTTIMTQMWYLPAVNVLLIWQLYSQIVIDSSTGIIPNIRIRFALEVGS